MLTDIAPLPTSENSAIRLHPHDNVAIARVALPSGVELQVGNTRVVTREAIPVGHKVALLPIPAGAVVRRYGQSIGRARIPIEAGRHVHTQNLAFEELELAYEFPAAETTPVSPPETAPAFLGY